VRLACARHLRDLETAHARGLWWDAEVVEDLRLFFSGLRHSKGEWAGQPILLEPWQLFVLGVLLGWKRADGTRRFRIAYIEVARKNGKSTIFAGLGLYLAFFDDEPGAEVYSAATKRDQAKILWSEAKRMVLRSQRLRERITTLVANLHDPATGSKFEPLGADADNLDGLNISGALVDELHAHKTRAMWDVLETATANRRQPLTAAITTSGTNRAGVCYELRLYVTKILEGLLLADEVFGMIYTIDDGDDWTQPASWAKANPNLGISVKVETLAAMCRKAQAQPSAQPAFLTKHLDVWVNADLQFLEMVWWQRAAKPFTLEDVAGVPCWIGIDLASKSDLAAVIAVFVQPGRIRVRTRFYLPAEMVHAGAQAEMAHFEGWARAGYLTLTEGNLIDFRVIREDVKALAKQVAIQEIGFDPYQATQVVTELAEAGLTLIEIPQTVKQLSGPMKAVRDMLREGTLEHDGNPVMAWNVSNVVAHEDANENVFPRKAARHLKIDGFTALLNALARPLVQPPPPPEPRITVIG
jgi:phage terminase large subunit-like protein